MKKVLLVLSFLLVAVLAACGGNDDKTEIVYWSMWNQTEPQAIALQEAIDDFEAKNEDIKVTVEWNGREIRNTLLPALQNGTKIDMWDEDLERVSTQFGSHALKLDDYFSKTYELTGTKTYEESVMGSLVDLGRSFNEDGSITAVPYQPFVFAVMYNKAHFTEAGITEVPETWDEFIAVCESLKTAGYDPLTTDDAYMDTLIGYQLARYKGSDWVVDLVNDETNAMWDDPAVLSALQDFEQLATNGYLSDTITSNSWPAGQQHVAAGDVSMYLNGTWLVNEIMASTGPDFEWGTFNWPSVTGGADEYAANYGSQAFQINKDSENADIIFELLVHLTVGKWDSELAKQSFGVPVSGTATWPTQLAEAKEVFNDLNAAYPWAAGVNANTDKHPVIVENFTKLLDGTITAEQFIAEMKK